jgi:uncharacterized membrane protein (UPF0127 family)
MRFHRLIGILIIGFVLFGSSCKTESGSKNIISQEITFTKEGSLTIMNTDSTAVAEFEIEIADNDYEIATGLMYRSKMKKNRGMLFIFPDEKPRFFYMKNTEIPLDLLYINSDHKIVSIHKNAIPFDEATLPASAPAKFVLEINAGLIDAYKIPEGYTVNFTKD